MTETTRPRPSKRGDWIRRSVPDLLAGFTLPTYVRDTELNILADDVVASLRREVGRNPTSRSLPDLVGELTSAPGSVGAGGPRAGEPPCMRVAGADRHP